MLRLGAMQAGWLAFERHPALVHHPLLRKQVATIREHVAAVAKNWEVWNNARRTMVDIKISEIVIGNHRNSSEIIGKS